VSKVDAERFVEGREAYVASTPFLQVIERIEEIEMEENGDKSLSFFFGFLDGVLADVRLAGKNAREQIDRR